MTTEVFEGLDLDIGEKESDKEPEKMASGLHGVLGVLLSSYLVQYVHARKLGHVLDSSATYKFKDSPPKRQPDVSFVSLEKMPVPLDEELTFAPDLAVEIVSKNDALYEVEQKVQHYQQVGVALVWVVRPFSKIVEVYQLADGLVPQVIGPQDELDGGEVLPGFKLPVKALFE
jgi:Uma2 family endonuclease